MPTGSGISASLGLAPESVYGTYVAPTKFYEFVSESLALNIDRIESSGIRADSRVMRSDDWTPGNSWIEGDIELELSTKNWAFLFGHILGGTVVTTGAGPYVHTYSGPGSLTGKSLSAQIGRPSTDGTVRAFSLAGCKVNSFELSCDVGTDPVPCTLGIVGKSETTATALTTPSYTSSNDIFAYTHGAVTVGGSSVPVKSATVTIDTPMDSERFYIGQPTISEPLENDIRDITGELTMDFASLTQYALFTGGSEAAVVLTFTRGTNVISFTFNARFDGATPEVGGRDLLELPLSFKALASSTDASALTIAITSSEATP